MERKHIGQNISVEKMDDINLEQIVAMLDNFASSDASRMKVDVSDEYMQG